MAHRVADNMDAARYQLVSHHRMHSIYQAVLHHHGFWSDGRHDLRGL
jgi:hypothetical protein